MKSDALKANTIPRPYLISYCSGDMLHSDFGYSLAQLCMYSANRGFHIGVHNVRTTLVEVGRGVQGSEGLRSNASHILFLDSDMKFPPNTLERLLRWNRDIVGCTYSMRRSPRAYTHESLTGIGIIPDDPRENPFEVKSLGFGCVLVRTEVLKKITRPWFRVEYPGGVDDLGADNHRSEDRTFCDRAREAGFKVWCDGDLSAELEHVGTFGFKLGHVEVMPQY